MQKKGKHTLKNFQLNHPLLFADKELGTLGAGGAKGLGWLGRLGSKKFSFWQEAFGKRINNFMFFLLLDLIVSWI